MGSARPSPSSPSWSPTRGLYSAPVYSLSPTPQIVGESDAVQDALQPVHPGVAIAIALMIVLHVLAALRHEFLLRDDALRRMLPFGRPRGMTPVTGRAAPGSPMASM